MVRLTQNTPTLARSLSDAHSLLGLENQIRAIPYLAVSTLPSAQVDVFQAYIGAQSIDLGLDNVQGFITELLLSESDLSFQAVQPSSTMSSAGGGEMMSESSYGAGPSTVGTGTLSGTTKVEEVQFGPQSPIVANPVVTTFEMPPMYERGAQNPLGAPPPSTAFDMSSRSSAAGISDIRPEDSMSNIHGSQTPVTGFTTPFSQPSTQGFSQPSTQGSSSGSFVPARPYPIVSSQPTPGPSSSGGAGFTPTKSYTSAYHEICQQRGLAPIWEFASAGPPHDKQWEAKLLRELTFFYFSYVTMIAI